MPKRTDFEYLVEAYKIAQESRDPSTQIGAIVIDKEGEIVLAACNAFPRGIEETAERWERPLKYKYVEHCEKNIAYLAARKGIATEGLTMYCSFYACIECARAIIQCGFSEVIGHDHPAYIGHTQWAESVREAMLLLDEAGVRHRNLKAKIGGIDIRVNGETIRP